MKVLWICGLPQEVQQTVLGGRNFGAYAAWSWVMGHLPPPPGLELHIACRTARHTRPESFAHAGAHFHLVPVMSRARILCLFHFDWRYFQYLAARLRPDVIHGWGTEDGYARTAIRLAPRRSLVQVQGCINAYRQRVPMHWITRLTALSERLALRAASHVVAENEYALNSARPWIRTRSVHVVEHPIRSEFLSSLPASGDGRNIIYVGAINDRKGIWDAINAFAAAAPPEWILTLVGSGRAEDLDRLRQRLAEPTLVGRVVHHARLDAAGIVAEMQMASIFLLPTRIDTGPTSLKEALAMGLWPVCYDNSGPGHYLRKFQFGNLADDLNPAALTEALRRAIAAKEWQRDEHRAKIETAIRPHFNRERIWQDLLKLYRDIVREG